MTKVRGGNAKNIFGLTSANAVAQIIQFSVFILLARDLGPAGFGEYLICLVAVAFSIAVSDFGRSSFLTRELAFQRLQISEFWDEALSRIALLSILALTVSLGFLAFGLQIAALACLLTSTQYAFQLTQAFAKSQLQTLKLSIALVIDKLSFLFAITCAIFWRALTPEVAILATALGQLLAVFILVAKSELFSINIRHNRVWKSLYPKSSFHMGVFSLSNTITSLDQVILGSLSGPRQTGLYGAVSKWFAPLGILSGVVGIVTANDAARRHSSVSRALSENKYVWISLILFGLVISIGALFSGNFVTTILGDSYTTSGQLVSVLAVSASLSLISSPLASLLQYFGKEKAVSVCIGLLGLAYLGALSMILSLGSKDGALVMSQLQLGLQIAILVGLLSITFWQSRSESLKSSS